jgi:hypothetical protein
MISLDNLRVFSIHFVFAPGEAHTIYAIEFVSHWCYNIIDFGGRALPAPVH